MIGRNKTPLFCQQKERKKQRNEKKKKERNERMKKEKKKEGLMNTH